MKKSRFEGSFYPDKCDELRKYFLESEKKFTEGKIRALIVPHAGYFYSGRIADLTYSLLKKDEYKRVMVIGPSHYVYFRSLSVLLEDSYYTPCGILKSDIEYANDLIKRFNFVSYLKEVHNEHSTEVQMPFVKNYLDQKTVEVVYGDIDTDKLYEFISYLIEDKDNLIVISTDLSHFHDLKTANKIDLNCLKSFEKLNLDLMENCEACGLKGLYAVIKVAKNNKLKSKLISYDTSATASLDSSRVVGYMSGIVYI